ncbi:MAG TPA: acyloxyacyl hydrolase [Pyrinomonadaceae bacterium]
MSLKCLTVLLICACFAVSVIAQDAPADALKARRESKETVVTEKAEESKITEKIGKLAEFSPAGEEQKRFAFPLSEKEKPKPQKFDFPEPENQTEKKAQTEAQNNRNRWVLPRGTIEYGAEIGFAPEIATWMSGPKYYDIRGHRHLLGSFRWGRILGNKGIVTVSWAVEFVPINIAIGNEVDNPRFTPGSTTETPTRRENTFGVGINPASFRFIFFPKWRLRPQLGAGIGLTRHFNRVPTIDGTKGNVHIDFQIGGQYMISERRALNFGYKYYHLSNVYLARRNPGYNVNMFFVGYSIFKK